MRKPNRSYAANFFKDWDIGHTRFKEANPHITKYDKMGKPKFAGWIFNGFDLRSNKYVKADKVHHDKIASVIKTELIENNHIKSSKTLPPHALIGQIEDMNVLIQNSIWQNIPVSKLTSSKPIKDLQNKGTWSPNQKEQIKSLRIAYNYMAENVIQCCL